ncbi:GNAT family N-acetyltransferase [Nocardioides sp. zg-579]|uniref:GNAT family N-acetyltransferase n=1 Tax=Nocardioides marmotae TaxID=2663857 RepID=A0A6I3JBQ0_9ACTN|nr:GNAT family N-acetyltransferase [Nocardioides marmotae]MCR6031828.1 GNAT family N-acetyltransferase [Gordonia jinghuaiqii]MTB95469.1 GNAT family N-acetyltransferase [Nocardioides marmotae]QKE00904.1 GNAT family N-acetyltransferase [Nocardioides marmotae]
MLSTRHGVRPLGSADLDAFLALTARDPVVNVFADYRARTTNLEPRWLGGEVWGRFDSGELVAACHVGANLVPIGATPDDARAFAERALTRGRTVSTIVGPHEAVEVLWNGVAGSWGRPREARWRQPHLEIAGPPLVEPDPRVRRTTRPDMAELYPACVAMYTEEVGVSPEQGGGAELYRARVTQLMNRGWSFAAFEDGRLVFKAEVACASPYAAQVQGVWVPPDQRGRGLAASGMAAVVEMVRAEIAPVVSLYVNEWNEPARRAYARVGFQETARFSTVMF